MTVTEPRSMTAPQQGPATRKWLSVLAVLVALMTVGATVVAGLFALGDEDPPVNASKLTSVDVKATDVHSRWNEVVADRGEGERLPSPVWKADETLGLDVSEHVLGRWGIVTLYRHPDQRLAAVDLVGKYVAASDRARMAATAVAAVAAISGLDIDDAERFVADDLGFGEQRLAMLAANLIESSFLDEGIKQGLLAEIESVEP